MTNRLFIKTPIGPIEVPKWEADKVTPLTNDELIKLAVDQNKTFCISPVTYAEIERRFLTRELQQQINPSVGFAHYKIHS